jgi:hypothetical protein
MPDSNDSYEVGYARPPRQTRFVKGQSGNPKGRPKGSQNLATVLAKVGRERVRVTGKGGSRSISKLEASLIQLSNRAASGELRAIREFVYLVKSLQDAEQSSPTVAVPHERDRAVMASIIERIRQSETPETEVPKAKVSPQGEE